MKKRILHVVGEMEWGGLQTWLMHILRHIDRTKFQMDFLVHTNQPCAYDEEIRAFGSQIIPCMSPSQLWMYASNFKQILRKYGPYDIIHSHLHHFSGYILRLARQVGVPIAIAHSHVDTSMLEAEVGFSRHLYFNLAKGWINHYATYGLGCSRNALANLFGEDWEKDSRWQLLYYGIDLNPFTDAIDLAMVRGEFGIPQDAFVIGHVGRFHEQKNHRFLLEIFAEIAKREPKMYLLLVGQGSLQPEMIQKVLEMDLGDRVIFIGSRPDIPQLMRGAMDIFLFPSLDEGLSIVLIEAQAAGLPCIFTDAIPQEVEIVKPLLRRVSLSQSAAQWAEVVLAQCHVASIFPQSEALTLLKQSPFCVEKSIQHLQNIYQGELTDMAVV